MKNKTGVLACLVILLMAVGCGEVVFRKVDCQAFSLTEEHYWFPETAGDSVVFVNSTNERKKFIVADKSIYHRPEYTSDTGCGCLEVSGMLLTSGTDSVWFKKEIRYVTDQQKDSTEDVVFVFDDVQSVFYETHRVLLDTYSIGSHSFSDVKKFEYTYTDEAKVKQVYLVKNLGIIRFEMVGGEVWTNANLTTYKTASQDTFTYSEVACE